jgi:hypothetical protein
LRCAGMTRGAPTLCVRLLTKGRKLRRTGPRNPRMEWRCVHAARKIVHRTEDPCMEMIVVLSAATWLVEDRCRTLEELGRSSLANALAQEPGLQPATHEHVLDRNLHLLDQRTNERPVSGVIETPPGVHALPTADTAVGQEVHEAPGVRDVALRIDDVEANIDVSPVAMGPMRAKRATTLPGEVTHRQSRPGIRRCNDLRTILEERNELVGPMMRATLRLLETHRVGLEEFVCVKQSTSVVLADREALTVRLRLQRRSRRPIARRARAGLSLMRVLRGGQVRRASEVSLGTSVDAIGPSRSIRTDAAADHSECRQGQEEQHSPATSLHPRRG